MLTSPWRSSISHRGAVSFAAASAQRDNQDITASADQNLRAMLGHQARWSTRGETDVVSGTLLATTGTPFPAAPYNLALRVFESPASRSLEVAAEWFSARRTGFSVYARDSIDEDLELECCRLGMNRCGALPVMSIDCSSSNLRSRGRLHLVRITTEEQLETFRTVAAEAYGRYDIPPHVVSHALSQTDHILQSSAHLYLAVTRGNAVGCCALTFDGGVAGIYWVAIRNQHCGHGYGTEMVQLLVELASSFGLRHAVLQAAPLAERLYRRLGFTEIDWLRCYCWPLRSRLMRSDA
jgi:RimJ/RimL family protein N-acetyltransferase